MLRKIELRNGERPVLSFVCEEEDFAISEVTILDEEQLQFLPRGLFINYPAGTAGERMRYWLDERSAHRSRHFKTLLTAAAAGNPGRDPLLTLLLSTHFTSCTDAYWLKEADEDRHWAEVSPYVNPHDSVIPRLLFDGGRGQLDLSVPRICPDLTNAGLQPKHWERSPGGRLSFCIANYDFTERSAPSETNMEFFAAQIASCMGFACVRNGLRADTLLGPVLVREGFTSGEIGLRGLFDILTTVGFAGRFPGFDLSDITLHTQILAPLMGEEAYADMMVFDALTLNTNRHALNFGFIVNNATGAVQGMAPLYGHGRTLLYAAALEDLKDDDFVGRYFRAHQRGKLVRYEEILPAFMRERHMERLEMLRAMRFREPDDPHCRPDPLVLTRLQELKSCAVDYALGVAAQLRGETGWRLHPVIQ